MFQAIFFLIFVSFVSSFDPTASRIIGDNLRDYGAYSILQASNNESHFVVVGDSWYGSDEKMRGPFIAKIQYLPDLDATYYSEFDDSISILWSMRLPASPYGYFNQVIETKDGRYVAMGSIYGFGDVSTEYSAFIAVFNDTGHVLHSKVISTDYTDRGRSVFEAKNGDLIICGYTNTGGLQYDVFVVRLNQTGEVIKWKKKYSSTDNDFCESLVELKSSGDIFALGKTKVGGTTSHDILVLKIKGSDGSLTWAKKMGGTSDEVGSGIIETYDGKLVLCGGTSSYAYSIGSTSQVFHKMDPSDGSTVWSVKFGKSGSYLDHCYGLAEDYDRNLVFIGGRDSNSDRMIFTKLSKNGEYNTTRIQSKVSAKEWGYSIFPNRDRSTYTYAGTVYITDKTHYYGSMGIVNHDFEICESYYQSSTLSDLTMPSSVVTGSFTVTDFTFKEVVVNSTDYRVLGDDISMNRSFCVYCHANTTALRTNENYEEICNKHGECDDTGRCDCTSYYSGSACETRILYCGGNRYDSSRVCSRIGVCTPSGCSCPEGYTGNYYACNEIKETTSNTDAEAEFWKGFLVWFIPMMAVILGGTLCIVVCSICLPLLIMMGVGCFVTILLPILTAAGVAGNKEEKKSSFSTITRPTVHVSPSSVTRPKSLPEPYVPKPQSDFANMLEDIRSLKKDKELEENVDIEDFREDKDRISAATADFMASKDFQGMNYDSGFQLSDNSTNPDDTVGEVYYGGNTAGSIDGYV